MSAPDLIDVWFTGKEKVKPSELPAGGFARATRAAMKANRARESDFITYHAPR
jgi:hypothetical protein